MLASNHKRMVRNTAMLYMRMLLAMVVTLYTSRVVLHVLGIEDFGIYQVVTGFVALLGFLQGAMTTATQRFLAFDLGESGGQNMSRIFSTSILIHALLAICIALLAETAGYWFVSTQLVIPDERISAALSAYHIAIISYVISVLMVPFTAMLMAHERMGIFAGIGILDVLLKLFTVIGLQYIENDKLVSYAWLLLAVNLAILMSYFVASKLIFPKIRLHCEWHPQQFKTMLSYTAWNTWGNLAAALSGQGTNVLLNIFFGPAVNAGRSIATQANGALNSFISSMQAAINPQIIKQYASGNHQKMHNLVQKASKYNFFLLLTISIPVLLHTDQLLIIWLTTPPPFASSLLNLSIILSLVESLSLPMMTSAQSTGKIRLYQTVIGGILLLNVPVAFMSLKTWHNPTVAIWTSIVLAVVALVARLFILKNLTGMAVGHYLKSVIIRVLLVSSASGAICYAITPKITTNTLLIGSLSTCLTTTILIIYLIGCDACEKRYIVNLAIQSYRKLIK